MKPASYGATTSNRPTFCAATLLACMLPIGCGASPETAAGNAGPGDPATSVTEGGVALAEPSPTVQYFEVHDRGRGMVQSVSPFPATWSLQQTTDGSLQGNGPGGVRLHPTQVSRFAWADDPFARQSIAQAGQQLAPPLPLEQILEQQIRPAAAAQGNQLVRAYPIPEVEGLFTRFGAAMVQTGSQRQWRALGSDWSDGRGTMTFVSIVQAVFRNQQMVTWVLQTTSLEAPDEIFEEAKRDYLYAIGNTQINPHWQQAMNGQLQGQIRANEAYASEMMARSRAAHQQRMAAIEAQGNAARSIGQTYSDILDINHSGYLKRDDMNTAGHSALIDSIGERTLIGNHETGEHYTVDAGSRYYWVASDATYVGTDNPLWDPRTDQRTNDVEWTKFVVER
ncbi:MAG: hypothetical protein DWQ36_10645 [Acidobacteria bacterium]|nr:MAG: hypothetical protein DWQ36_10645 [Acidobacteriota bacterium]